MKKYSISEWWLEPNSDGPGIHQHEDNDEVFYVLEGTTSILIGDRWINAEKEHSLGFLPKPFTILKTEPTKKQTF